MRMLEALREREQSVKMGLSEKVNFEVALLSAVEASRKRAIDSLIREISGLAKDLPENSDKKKVAEVEPSAAPEFSYNQPPPTEPEIEQTTEEITVEETPEETSGEELVLSETPPELEELVAEIPESTRKIIEEQLKGRFREVQKIDTGKLV